MCVNLLYKHSNKKASQEALRSYFDLQASMTTEIMVYDLVSQVHHLKFVLYHEVMHYYKSA